MNKVRKTTDKDECPHCKSKKIEKAGIKGATVGKEGSIPHLERYNCTDCGNPFFKRLN